MAEYKQRVFYGPGNSAGRARFEGIMAARMAASRRNLRNQVRKLKTKVARISPEVMKWTSYDTQNSVANTAIFIHLSDIDQGDANGQRAGLDITVKSLLFCPLHVSAAASTSVLRQIIFKWHESVDNPPTIGDILQNDTGGANPNACAPLSIAYRDRFKVLSDKIIRFSEVDQNRDNMYTKRQLIPLKGKIKYGDSNGTAYEKDAIFVMYYSPGIISLTTNWELKYHD